MSLTKKIVILGHFGVGKTSLLRRYVDQAFSEDYLVTLGVHIKKKEVTINQQKLSLIIWDIEGKTSIHKARTSYLLGAHAFVYVFDVTRPETYENVEEELTFLDNNYKNIPHQLVGNKSDMFTNTLNASFFAQEVYKNCVFTSAKTGEQVEEMFLNIAQKTI